MRVWLIAKRDVWEKLQHDKELLYDPEYLPSPLGSWYEWMRQQMAKRLANYQGHCPWWAWVRWTNEKPMPDLRSWDNELNCFAEEEAAVRLELVLADHEVLCSDFGSWCLALTDEYVAKTQAEQQHWESLAPQQQTHDRLEQSWEAIFDLNETHWDIPWRTYNPLRVQGVFEHLRLQDVTKVTHFRCRHPKRKGLSCSSSLGL
jgi:hypothetical protein